MAVLGYLAKTPAVRSDCKKIPRKSVSVNDFLRFVEYENLANYRLVRINAPIPTEFSPKRHNSPVTAQPSGYEGAASKPFLRYLKSRSRLQTLRDVSRRRIDRMFVRVLEELDVTVKVQDVRAAGNVVEPFGERRGLIVHHPDLALALRA